MVDLAVCDSRGDILSAIAAFQGLVGDMSVNMKAAISTECDRDFLSWVGLRLDGSDVGWVVHLPLIYNQ